MKPTVTSLRPAFFSASMMFRHALAVGASGFSQKTGLAASIHAMTSGSCAGPWLQIITASTSGDDEVQSVDVRPPHAAGADHADAQGHVTSLSKPSGSLEAQSARGKVLADLDSVGQRVGRVARVHVLLANDVQVLVEIGERLDQSGHLRLAGGRGHRATPADRRRE